MKRLLCLLVALCFVGVARSESYRILYLLIDPKLYTANSLPTFIKDEASWKAAITGDQVIIKWMTTVKLDANGLGEAEETLSIAYAQSYDSDGTPRELTKRKVGGTVRLKKQPDNRVHVSCEFSELERWIFHGAEKQFPQPIFKSRSIVQSFASSTTLIPQMLGGGAPKKGSNAKEEAANLTEENFGWAFVIQQIPDSLTLAQ